MTQSEQSLKQVDTIAQRQNLYKTIWDAANNLRGQLDGWYFRDYTLSLLFYRFLSDYFVYKVNEYEHKNNPSFNYADLKEYSKADEEHDREIHSKRLGFYLKPNQLFENVFDKYQNSQDLSEQLSLVFKSIADSAEGNEKAKVVFEGLFDELDFHGTKLGANPTERSGRIAALMTAINKAELGVVHKHDIDAFGDAYEFLMKMYASEAGKSGGEFYTPQEVSDLVSRLATFEKEKFTSVYDPCCGSGSLLLRAARSLEGKDEKETERLRGRVHFYGQEVNLTTYNLCRMNMLLHAIRYDNFHIHLGNTLYAPNADHLEQKFDIVISNPPYSLKVDSKQHEFLQKDLRFKGIGLPKSKADIAFVLHALACMGDDATAVLVLPDGVLSRPLEKKVRQYLVEENVVDAVVSVPGNIFFGTTTKTSLLVLKKNRTAKDVLFIEAQHHVEKSAQGSSFVMTQSGIDKVMELYAQRKDVEYLSRVVLTEEIANAQYALTVNTYVEAEEQVEEFDSQASLQRLNQAFEKSQAAIAKINEIMASWEAK